MISRWMFVAALIHFSLVSVSTSWAGAPAILPGEREEQLPHVCKGGPDHGNACEVEFIDGQIVTNDCPKGKCLIDFLHGPGSTFNAKVTIVADDSLPPGENQETRVTVTVEVKKDGEVHILTDTAQTMVFAHAFGFPAGEFGILAPSAPSESSLTSLFLLAGAPQNIAQGLRDIFEKTGVPVVVDVKPHPILQTPHHESDDPLGSALRFKVKMRFVDL